MRRRQKFAGENRRRVLSGFLREALGQRRQSALGKIEFEPLDAMHGEKQDARGKGLAVADLGGEVVEGREINTAEAKSDGRKLQDRAPEFLAGVGKRRDDKGAGAERSGRLGSLIKASAGHDAIVVCGVGKLQMERDEGREPKPSKRASKLSTATHHLTS